MLNQCGENLSVSRPAWRVISVPHDYYQDVDGGGASDGDEVTVTLTIKDKTSSFVKKEIEPQ